MPPNAARKMSARQTTQPFSTSSPVAPAPKRSYRPPAPGRREATKPFRSVPPEVRESDIRQIAPRVSYRPPAAVGPASKKPSASKTPSAPPRASVSLAAFKSEEPEAPHLRAVSTLEPSAPAPVEVVPEGRDDTPSGPRAVQMPSPPPVPREAVLAMPTTQLPLEEIDYEEAYAYDADAMEARLSRKSIVPEALSSVASDVRQSLTPAGRAEAKKELRAMRRVSLSGLAQLFRKAADLLDAYA